MLIKTVNIAVNSVDDTIGDGTLRSNFIQRRMHPTRFQIKKLLPYWTGVNLQKLFLEDLPRFNQASTYIEDVGKFCAVAVYQTCTS